MSDPYQRAYIPYGAYWSSPFARWQGSFAELHSLEFAAAVARDALAEREVPLDGLDYGVLGTTIPQPHSFYGLPWVTGMLGAPQVTGPTINQACATSARCLQVAADEVERGGAGCALVLAADRASNGPHLYYPAPTQPGGTGAHENWVLDNFSHDPYAGLAMVETAENVARRHQVTTEEQHEVAALRHEQYAQARSAGFHERYMKLPFSVPDPQFRRTAGELSGDEGVFPTSPAKLAALSPVLKGGTVTYGGQTHPADGNAGLLVTDEARARELATDPSVTVRIRGFGSARVEKGYMPEAPAPAAERALAQAGVAVSDLSAIATHNPFAVNDVLFARRLGVGLEAMNTHGCSLVWGHPQGPTGLRSVIEVIEALHVAGGGYGLFSGCAAGDTAMAVVVEVST